MTEMSRIILPQVSPVSDTEAPRRAVASGAALRWGLRACGRSGYRTGPDHPTSGSRSAGQLAAASPRRAGGSELSTSSSWAMLSFQSSPAAGPGNCRRAVRGWPLNLATALRSQRRLLPRDWCSVPGEELPGGPVVRQQRQPDRARRGLGRVTVTGGGGAIKVGPPQPGSAPIHLHPPTSSHPFPAVLVDP